MRKLYREFFYIPEHGKIREKVMLARIATTVAVVLVCLAAMSFTAYAYFSCNVTSGTNRIKAANFEASITITDSHADPVAVTKDGKIQTATLEAGTYTVELTEGTSTAETGFCVITIGDTDYYTQQIGVDVERALTDASVKFTVVVSSSTKMEILSHWGTSSCYGYENASGNPRYIESGDEIDLSASTVDDDETPSTEEQGTTDTEPTTTATTVTTATTSYTEATESAETTETKPTGTTETTTESTDTVTSTMTQPATEPTATTGAPTTEESK